MCSFLNLFDQCEYQYITFPTYVFQDLERQIFSYIQYWLAIFLILKCSWAPMDSPLLSSCKMPMKLYSLFLSFSCRDVLTYLCVYFALREDKSLGNLSNK